MNTTLNTLHVDTQYHSLSPFSSENDSLLKDDCKEVKKSQSLFSRYSQKSLFAFWNMSHLDQENISEKLLLVLAQNIYENKNFRDILLLSSLTPMSLEEMQSVFNGILVKDTIQDKEKIESKNSSHFIECTLKKIFTDPHFYPNEKLVQNSIWHLYDILTCVEEKNNSKYSHPLYSLLAYIYWWNGEEKSALDACRQALKENDEYVLARIIFTALKAQIFPAWYHQKENIQASKTSWPLTANY